MNPSTHDLNTLQMEFLTSITRWMSDEVKPLPAAIHFTHIICLLQSVGFYIRRIDSSGPKHVTPLRDGKIGTRVVITCGHSGDRCFLELPETPDQCKCLNKSSDLRDEFSEATGGNNSVIESGSHVAPPVSKDLKHFLETILTMLIHFIQGTSANDVNPNATSTPTADAKRLSGFINEMICPIVKVSSPNGKGFAISRPIEGTTQNQKESEPPFLQTKLSHSSPNLSIKEDASCNGSVLSHPVNKVIEMLEKCITMLKQNEDMSPKRVTFAIDKNKSVSSPNLTSKVKAVSPVIAKCSANITPAKSLPSLNTKRLSAKLPVKTTSTASVRTPKTLEHKSDDHSKNSANKSKNMYAHVKSTIPKPSFATKIIKKS